MKTKWYKIIKNGSYYFKKGEFISTPYEFRLLKSMVDNYKDYIKEVTYEEVMK